MSLPGATVADIHGNIFPGVTQSIVHYFNGLTDGSGTGDALDFDPGGDAFGTLNQGGLHNAGSIFELSGSNYQTFTILTPFNGTNGNGPTGTLAIDAKGDIFGETAFGGLYGDGTIYELSGPGYDTLTTLLNFNSSDGTRLAGGLTPDAQGDLFGLSVYGNSGIGPTTGDLFELTNTGFAVPEPAGLSLLAFASLAGLRRRQRVGRCHGNRQTTPAPPRRT